MKKLALLLLLLWLVPVPAYAQVNYPGREINPDLADVAAFVVENVQKDSPGTLVLGNIVYIAGFDIGADVITVELADADDPAARPAAGIITTEATNDSNGFMVRFGRVENLDTSGLTVGQSLYLSTTPGLFTATRPAGEDSIVQIIARVLRAHPSKGVVEVGIESIAATPNLNDGNVFVGSAGNLPVPMPITGDITMNSLGVTSFVGFVGVEQFLTFTKAQLEGRLSDVTDLALASGDVHSGAHDYGDANSVEMVNGSSPIVDAIGEFALDTTSDQFVFFGGAKRVLPYTFQFCEYLNGLSSSDDDRPLWINSAHSGGVTIVSALCTCTGTCSTEADIELEVDSGGVVTSMTGTIDCEDTTTGDTPTALSGAAASLALGDTLRFDTVNNPSGGQQEYVLCVNYTVDAD